MSLSRSSRFPLTSIRTRLTALFVTIFGLVLIGYSVLLYQVFVGSQEREFDAALFNYTVDVAHAIDLDLFGELRLRSNVLNDSEKVFPFALGETFLQILTIDGRPFARSRSLGRGTLPLTRDEREDLLHHRVLFKTISSREFSRNLPPSSEYRQISYLIDKPGTGQFVLQAAVPMQILKSEKRELITFFVFSIPLVLLIGAFGGLFLSRRALMPVNAIIAKVRDISATKLSARVPVPRVQDEMHRLAVTLNHLLDRLEHAFQSQESFVSDASHQLKTPLAILRGEIDLMRSRARSAEEVEGFLASASQEVGYLSRIVEDLLVLARVDSGGTGLSVQKLRFDEVVLESVSRLEKIAQPKGVRFSLNLTHSHSGVSSYEIDADSGLMRSLVDNLIENAVKYSPEKGIVTVDLADQGAEMTRTVSDQGGGIPEDALPKIFDRFFRAESNRETISGSGLGLAIVKKITEAHRGRIQVRNLVPHGASFQVTLRR